MSNNLGIYEATNIQQLNMVDLTIVTMEYLDENKYFKESYEFIQLASDEVRVSEKAGKAIIRSWFETNIGDFSKLQQFFEWKYL